MGNKKRKSSAKQTLNNPSIAELPPPPVPDDEQETPTVNTHEDLSPPPTEPQASTEPEEISPPGSDSEAADDPISRPDSPPEIPMHELAKFTNILNLTTLVLRATAPFSALSVLDLSNMGLGHIDGTTLVEFTHLQILILRNNRLSNIDTLCERVTHHLWHLDVSNNELTAIPPIKNVQVMGGLIMYNNRLTFGGIQRLLSETCFVEIGLDGNVGCVRTAYYRPMVTRLAGGVVVLDETYITHDERAMGVCLPSINNSIPLVPELADPNRLNKARPGKLKPKQQMLHRLLKKRQSAFGHQMLSLLLIDLEEHCGGKHKNKNTMLEGEKRRIRFLSMYYAQFFNITQTCPSLSLFQYTCAQNDPSYYCSQTGLEKAANQCSQYSEIPDTTVDVDSNLSSSLVSALPFCTQFWHKRKAEVRYLVQLSLLAIHFTINTPLVEEVMRRVLLRSNFEAPESEKLSLIAVDMLSRCTGGLPPYARLCSLLLLLKGLPSVNVLLSDCLTPPTDEYLCTLALSSSKMLAYCGFVIALEPDEDGEYAVSGDEETFQRDYTLPGRFVQYARHPFGTRKYDELQSQKERLQNKAMQLTALEEQRKAISIQKKTPQRHVTKRIAAPLGGTKQEKLQFWRNSTKEQWNGVAALDESNNSVSAQYYSTYRTPQIGEQVLVTIIQGSNDDNINVVPTNANAVQSMYTITDFLQEENLLRIIPNDVKRESQIERAEEQDVLRQKRVKKLYETRNNQKSKFWNGSKLQPQPDLEPPIGSMKLKRQQTNGKQRLEATVSHQQDESEESQEVNKPTTDELEEALYIGNANVFWTTKGYWKLFEHTPIDTNKPMYSVMGSPSSVKGYISDDPDDNQFMITCDDASISSGGLGTTGSEQYYVYQQGFYGNIPVAPPTSSDPLGVHLTADDTITTSSSNPGPFRSDDTPTIVTTTTSTRDTADTHGNAAGSVDQLSPSLGDSSSELAPFTPTSTASTQHANPTSLLTDNLSNSTATTTEPHQSTKVEEDKTFLTSVNINESNNETEGAEENETTDATSGPDGEKGIEGEGGIQTRTDSTEVEILRENYEEEQRQLLSAQQRDHSGLSSHGSSTRGRPATSLGFTHGTTSSSATKGNRGSSVQTYNAAPKGSWFLHNDRKKPTVVADPNLVLHPYTKEAMDVTANQTRRLKAFFEHKRPQHQPAVDPATGKLGCSKSLALASKGYSWETQSNFFLPSLFRTKLSLQQHEAPQPQPATTNKPKHNKRPHTQQQAATRSQTTPPPPPPPNTAPPTVIQGNIKERHQHTLTPPAARADRPSSPPYQLAADGQQQHDTSGYQELDIQDDYWEPTLSISHMELDVSTTQGSHTPAAGLYGYRPQSASVSVDSGGPILQTANRSRPPSSVVRTAIPSELSVTGGSSHRSVLPADWRTNTDDILNMYFSDSCVQLPTQDKASRERANEMTLGPIQDCTHPWSKKNAKPQQKAFFKMGW